MASAAAQVTSSVAVRRNGRVVARLSGASKKFGEVYALRQLSLEVRAGELLAVLGPNGAGKTTAIKLLLGLAPADTGHVAVFGGDPRKPENRMRTGAMLQVARVPEKLRVREHIDLFSSYYPSPLPLAESLRLAGLEGRENWMFGELSGGQKQRVLFALAVCGDPDLLFLDEPTVGLDVEARRLLWSQIRQLLARGKTVLLTTHYLEEADALADRIVVIHRGAVLAEGTPAEIKSRVEGRQIRCRTSLPVASLCSIPGVREVHSDRGVMLIRTTAAERVTRELLRLDPDLQDLEVTRAGLEDAFLALTCDPETENPQMSGARL